MRKILFKIATWHETPFNDYEGRFGKWLLNYEHKPKSWIGQKITRLIWKFIEKYAQVVPPIICRITGHYVTNDHCCKPDHRYCMQCEKTMPYCNPTKLPFEF